MGLDCLLRHLMTLVTSYRSYAHWTDEWLERVPEAEPLPEFGAHPSPVSHPLDLTRPSSMNAGGTAPQFALSPAISSKSPLFPDMPCHSTLASYARTTSTQQPPPPHFFNQMPIFTPINKEFDSEQSLNNHTNFTYRLPIAARGAHSAIDTTQKGLVPTSVLPDHLKTLFSFEHFNAMQSKAFNVIYSTDDNVVVSAPTGGGKTACFELAIARLMQNGLASGSYKVIARRSDLLIPR
jgi:DEAD/DEAH box helicase